MTDHRTTTLLIETGPHAGAAQRLADGLYIVGSGDQAQIVLRDDAIEPLHVLLEVSRRGIRIEPLHGRVEVAGDDAPLNVGEEQFCRLPVAMTVGETRLVLRAPAKVSLLRRKRTLICGLAAAAGVLGGLAAAVTHGPFKLVEISLTDPVMAEAAATPTPSVAADQSAAGHSAPAARTRSVEVVQEPVKKDFSAPVLAAALKARLSAHELTAVEVVAAGNLLRATGTLSKEEMALWREVQAWYDTVYARHLPILSEVKEGATKAEAPPLAIQSVWFGAEPYLVALDGQRYGLGSAVGEGWTVERIEVGRVLLRRNAETVALNF